MKILLLLVPIALFLSCGDDDHKYKHYIYTDVGAVNYQVASPAPNPIPASGSVHYSDFIIPSAAARILSCSRKGFILGAMLHMH